MSATAEKLKQEYEKFKKSPGGFFCPDYGTLKISGTDARDFLHRLTTQDVNHLSSGEGFLAALLQSNGAIVSIFDFYNPGPFFLIVAEKKALQETHAHLEKFHFAEQLEIQDVTEDFKFISVQFHGRGFSGGAEIQFQVPKTEHGIAGSEDFFSVNERDFDSGSGFHLLVKSAKVAECIKSLEKNGIPSLSIELWGLLRAEAGIFSFGQDVTGKNLILEAPVAGGVHRNKGCYPGQEMVERVFTYGNLGKKLVGLRWPAGVDPAASSEVLPDTPVKLFAGETEAGSTTSIHVFPWSQKVFGFAVVRKPHYEPGTKLKLGSSSVEVEVFTLPHQFEIKRELD